MAFQNTKGVVGTCQVSLMWTSCCFLSFESRQGGSSLCSQQHTALHVEHLEATHEANTGSSKKHTNPADMSLFTNLNRLLVSYDRMN